MTNNVISLDVFDTAIERAVYLPTDIFKLIEDEIGKDFYKKRVEAEKQAREVSKYYALEDIYKFLPEFEKDFEVRMELSKCMANSDILEMYLKDPSKYIFISDMYLSSEDIKNLLEFCGYENPKVFVSCELKEVKSGGGLFKKVQELAGVKISEHYGDNYVADIEGARLAGIEKVNFQPALHKIELDLPKVKNPLLKKFLAHAEYTAHPLRKVALNIVPLVVGFTQWVLSERKEGQRIFFLSRDMYVPYLLAKEYAKDVYYLHASRRSMYGACKRSTSEALRKRAGLLGTLEDYISDIPEIKEYLESVGIRNGDIIADIGYSGTIQAAINEVLGIETEGMYMQVADDVLPGINTKMYLNRKAIQFYLMIESILGSPEDCVVGYKDGKPLFSKENEERKELAQFITKDLFEMSKMFMGLNICSTFDVEQILIHQQFYPSKDVLDLFNRGIFSNRKLGESIIGFDRNRILKGELRGLYANSYCKPLFKRLLEEDRKLRHLSQLLD